MATIKLNYAAAVELAKKMQTNAKAFEANQKALKSNVAALKSSWSGSASDIMQKELQDMNKVAAELQKSLLGMADFVGKAAEALKAADKANVPK